MNLYIKYFIIILILFISYLITYIYLYECNLVSYFIPYTINDKTYKVLENDNYSDAAHILNKVDTNIIKLINYIDKKYSKIVISDINKKKFIDNIIYKCKLRYKSESLLENFPEIKGKNVSYNLNKGDEISLCLRDYDNKSKFHNFNDIMFVSIHELAHSCTTSYEHNTEFWNNFKFLLANAIELGIYNNYNYRNNPVNYCSMKISYNPIFDNTLDDFI